MVAQWVRCHTLNAGVAGSIPDQGTRSHMLQLRSGTVKWKKKKKRRWERGQIFTYEFQPLKNSIQEIGDLCAL